MSEVLARIKVRETHGIRRFLYPLSVTLPLPPDVDASTVGLADSEGQPIPCHVSQIYLGNDAWSRDYRCDFAVSLEPFADRDHLLTVGTAGAVVDDPLQATFDGGSALTTHQKRFSVSVDWEGFISAVVYDGIVHLRGSMEVARNGSVVEASESGMGYLPDPLRQSVVAKGVYSDDDCAFETEADITACKSWATVTHTLEHPKAGDEVIFMLPLAVTSPTLTCDFGIGGGIYGKLQADAVEEIVWRSEFTGENVRWSVTTAGRMDYVGEIETRTEFLPQRWFHMIDSDKALAVAITAVPNECRELTVTLQATGDVKIAFRLGDRATERAVFGVCWHFLNDIPALSAATNPQSILLPPIVELLLV